MNFSKFVLASDGQHAGVLLDGVFIGQGIQRLDFSAEEKNGKMRSTIRIMDLDVGTVSLERGDEKFSEFLEGMTKSPRFWGVCRNADAQPSA